MIDLMGRLRSCIHINRLIGLLRGGSRWGDNIFHTALLIKLLLQKFMPRLIISVQQSVILGRYRGRCRVGHLLLLYLRWQESSFISEVPMLSRESAVFLRFALRGKLLKKILRLAAVERAINALLEHEFL